MHPSKKERKKKQQTHPSQATTQAFTGVATTVTPSFGLNTSLHIFQSSGSAVLKSRANSHRLTNTHSNTFISTSANLRPRHPLGPCRKVINALGTAVSGKWSQRSGSKASASSPQNHSMRLMALASMY